MCKALRDAVVDGSVRHLGSGSKFGRRGEDAVFGGKGFDIVAHGVLEK